MLRPLYHLAPVNGFHGAKCMVGNTTGMVHNNISVSSAFNLLRLIDFVVACMVYAVDVKMVAMYAQHS